MLVLESLKEWGVPTTCPSCGTPLKTTELDVYCPNENCPAQVVLALANFIKKLDIKNVSSASLENFKIMTYDNLLDFRPNRNYKSQMKFYKELEDKLFKAPAKVLLSAMNFKGLSDILLGKVFDFYGYDTISNSYNDPNLFSFLMQKGLPEGIGEITLQKFCENLPKNMEIVLKICADGRYNPDVISNSSLKKNGKSVCFTGALVSMGRNEASKMAEKAGYEVKSGVSRGLTYLVTNDPNSGSGKAKKAREFGTTVINEKQFLELVKTEESEVFDL